MRLANSLTSFHAECISKIFNLGTKKNVIIAYLKYFQAILFIIAVDL